MLFSQKKKLFSSIHLQPSLAYNQEISKLAIIFYNVKQPQRLQQIVGKNTELIEGISLLKKQQNFWLIKPCREENQSQLQEIQRLVGLSETIVCLELSNVLETFIQKSFCRMENELMYTGLSHKLIFIRDIYKDKQGIADMRYFESIKKALPFIMESSTLTTNRISIVDLVQIYECDKVEYVSRVKAIYQKYSELRRREEKIAYANRLVFDQNKSRSQIKNQMASMKLSRQIENKLLWKLEQLSRHNSWKQEEQKANSQKFKKMTFLDLNQRISFPALSRFHQEWTANSLTRLKKIFRRIGNQGKSRLTNQFKQEYATMKTNLLRIKSQLCDPPSQKIIQNMLTQLQNFYEYHSMVIQDASLGSLRFLREEAKYIWKYRNNLYKKIIAVLLLIALAFFQDSYIASFAFLILAIITLTLRC